jgi:DNA-binding MarR family transcriptional regulator
MNEDTTQQCAANVMDTFHAMMRAIRPEKRKCPSSEMSMQQFRALITMKHNEGASLSLVSEHLGATISATSKLIDGMVERGYIGRETDADDRRKLTLALTEAGERALESVHLEAISRLAQRLVALSTGERAMVDLAMDLLRTALVSTQPAEVAIQQK